MKRRWFPAVIFGLVIQCHAKVFYLDSWQGNDAHDGQSEQTAWKSLTRANLAALGAGDRLLLKRGSRFKGSLKLVSSSGTADQPIIIEPYGKGRAPFIDASGHLAGVHLLNSRHVIIQELEITADGGRTVDGSRKDRRFGVYVQGTTHPISHIVLEGLTIYKIFPEAGSKHEGHNAVTFMGTAISIEGAKDRSCTDFIVRNCRIAQTGFKAVNMKRIRNVQVLNNFMKDIGGPALQPSLVEDLVVRGNTVNASGSDMDSRMHARGSGIWPWGCNRVLIEKNKFMHARGKADSCGVHIDFNCRDVVVQYNLSIDNEGGFIEILGNNYNCAYRYNISINDGARIKGKNRAYQEGKILWTSGFVGVKREKKGPYNSYIYNNTIYTGPKIRACFSIAPTTEGLLIANNIFHIMGKTLDVPGDQDTRNTQRTEIIQRAQVENNLYFKDTFFPETLPFSERNRLAGNVRFSKPGGLEAKHYIPQNKKLVKDQGIFVSRLEGDEIGLRIGLEVTKDFFGNPIVGKPDMGAIELDTPSRGKAPF